MRASRLRTTMSLAAVALSAAAASAQVSSNVELRANASTQDDVREWHGASVVAANLRFDRPRWALASTGALTSVEDRWRGGGSLTALMRTPTLGPLQLSASSEVSRTFRAGAEHNELSAEGRASLRFGRWGAWAGLDARYVDGTAAPASDPWPVLGAWQQFGSALVSLQLAPRRTRVTSGFSAGPLSNPDTLKWNDTLGIWEPYHVPARDSSLISVFRSWSDAEMRVVWARGRWAVDATLGGRLASGDIESSMWTQVQALYALGPRVALIGTTGNQAADPEFGWKRQSFASLGVRLLGAPEPPGRLPAEVRPTAADFRVVPLRGEEHLVRVRVPNARMVELSGDFTAWQPLALSRASSDWWQATITIPPGTHHVNIRVNGDAWTAPPGIPSIEDEFNGTVGLVVVQ